MIFFTLKPNHLEWALPWQKRIQERLQDLETIEIAEGCFVSPEAHLFAEPGRKIILKKGSWIAAEVFVHGPLELGENASINHRSSLDGGAKGVRIGPDSRIGPNCSVYAFNHGINPHAPVRHQPVTSQGIWIGQDVWVGSQVCVTDGVVLHDHCVVGMGAVVTNDVEAWSIVGGVPARPIGQRKQSNDPSVPN